MSVGDLALAEDDEAGDVESRARVRMTIMRHLRRHPLAGDTADGILSCWLSGSVDAVRVIDEVIASMVAAGELTAQRLPDGRWFYRRGGE